MEVNLLSLEYSSAQVRVLWNAPRCPKYPSIALRERSQILNDYLD